MKMYLKISAMLMMLSTFVLTSCDDDDDNGYPLLPAKNLVATPGDARVALKWEAPASDHIKEYNVTWTPGNGNVVVANSSTSYLAEGLTNGTKYTFSVYVVYDAGKSEAITAKDVIPSENAADYAPVLNLKATPKDKSIGLSWTKPAESPKATLTGYTITVNPKDIENIQIDDPDVTSYNIEGLTNGKEYTVGIVANYSDNGKSAEVSVAATPTAAIQKITVEGADYVSVNNENHAIEVYYNKPADLSNVELNITAADGIDIKSPQTFDLSGGKTGTLKINDKLSYTVSATVDLLIREVTATYADLTGQITLNQDDQTILVDFGDRGIDKKAVIVNLTLSDDATLVNPTENPAKMNLSEPTKIELKGKYDNAVSYTISCNGVQIFDPADVTGKAIPADWTRLINFNGKALPNAMAIYQVAQYNNAKVNAYVIMWSRDAAHTVYSDGTLKTLAELKGMADADAPAILVAGDSAAKCYAVHDSRLVYYPAASLNSAEPQATNPCFAINGDGSWSQHSAGCKTENGIPVLTNFDGGNTVWDAREAFASGGLFLNPAAEGGFTPGGSDPVSQCFFGVNLPDNGQVAAFVVCSKSGDAEGISQDDVCRMLIGVGINYGFPVCNQGVVGLYINGSEVIPSTVPIHYAVGVK